MRKKITLILLILFLTIGHSSASFLLTKDDGIKAYRQKQYVEAHKIFLNYTINNPSDSDGFYMLALVYKALKNDKKARTYFEQSYKMAFQDGALDKITFEKDLKGDLNDYFDMAALYFEKKDFEKADRFADIMLSISNECADAYFMKARIAVEKNNKKEALDNLNMAIIFDNSLLDTTLAKQLEITKVPEVTKEIYSRSATKHYYQGDILGAIDYIRKYLNLDNRNIDIYNMLIDCYIKKDMLDKAQDTLNLAFMASENNISIILKQAELYRLLTGINNEQYEKTLLKGYKINPNNRELLLALGNYYIESAQYQKAVPIFEILINIDDTFYEGYFGYVYSLIKSGDTKKAISYIQKAGALNKKTSEIDYLLAKICENKGEYIDAIQYLNSAINKEENQNYILEHAKMSYIVEDYSQSLEDLKRAEKNKAYYELLAQNAIKTNNPQLLKRAMEVKGGLDKTSLMYKYYLYEQYKMNSQEAQANVELNAIEKFNPKTLREYIELINIFFLLNKTKNALKLSEAALKKYNNSFEIYSILIQNFYMLNDDANLRQTIEKTEKLFN